jgi:hypothetical protein
MKSFKELESKGIAGIVVARPFLNLGETKGKAFRAVGIFAVIAG